MHVQLLLLQLRWGPPGSFATVCAAYWAFGTASFAMIATLFISVAAVLAMTFKLQPPVNHFAQ